MVSGLGVGVRPVYSVVVPARDEALVLPVTVGRLVGLLDRLDGPGEVVFVDDGSGDASFEVMCGAAAADPAVEVRREAQLALGVALHARPALAECAFAVVERLSRDPERPFARKGAQRTLYRIVDTCPDQAPQALPLALAACDDAQIGDMVRALPEGLGTVVGDRGYRLSGGEKQRLAIARLLLKAPDVVVLDDNNRDSARCCCAFQVRVTAYVSNSRLAESSSRKNAWRLVSRSAVVPLCRASAGT